MDSLAPKPLGDLFSEAVELEDPAARSAYLDEACAGNAELRRRIEALLAADAAAGPLIVPGDRGAAEPEPGLPGTWIGRYKLLEQIGEGGCGVVFMAEQERPVRRRVALKLIKLGLDTKSVIARFEAERQALAMMDHPNIAKVLDAGTTEGAKSKIRSPKSEGCPKSEVRSPEPPPCTSNFEIRPSPFTSDFELRTSDFPLSPGRPYFVMELVRGIKITEYCDLHGLSTRQRLELFIQVCQAVQHAHQKGIIHRDLKPSNILVTELDGVPVPKVIDFGIAKAIEGRLTDQTLFTSFEQFLGTPAYMSPEQAAMTAVDVDTRSDIYSLGVLLYELLTGGPPFDQRALLEAGFDAMRRTIREVEPLRPSTRLTRELARREPGSARGARAVFGGPPKTPSARGPAGAGDREGLASGEPPEDAGARRALPSDLRSLILALRGDLDWIVMKCLAKERGRRYETANALAMDLKRHLHNEAVLARPPSRFYAFRKTVRRHRVGVAATAAVIVTLAAGVAGSFLEAARARRAERAADSSAARRAETAYATDMNRAGTAVREGDLARARSLLRRYRPEPGAADLRGWEWRHLAWEARGDEHLTLAGHSNRVACVRFLDDDTLLSVGHGDQLGILWNLKQNRVVGRWTNEFQPSEVAVTPEQHQFYYSYWPPYAQDLRRVDWEARADAVAQFRAPTNFPQICGVVCAANAPVLAVRSPHRIEVVDLNQGASLGAVEVGESEANTAALSPNARLLAVGTDDGRLIWWSVDERRVLAVDAKDEVPRPAIHRLCFSPEGQRLLSVEESGMRLWRVADRTVERVLDRHASSSAAAFSPVGTLLALGSGAADLVVLEVGTGQPVRTFRGHTDQVQTVDFSPDGRRLASGSRNGEVKVWSLDSQPATPLSARCEHWYAAFAPDGSAFFTVASEREQAAECWSARTLESLGRIRRDDLPDAKGVLLPGGRTAAIVVPGDGRLLLRGATNRTVLRAHAVGTTEVAASADGRWLVTHSWGDQHLLVWRLPELELVRDAAVGPLPGGGYMFLCLSPDGRRLAGATGTGQLDVWELPALKRILSRQFLTPVENVSLAFSPDARRLAVAGADAAAVILDLEQLHVPVTPLAVPPGNWPMCFSPDGTRLAIGAGDAVQLLDARDGEQLVLLGIRAAQALAFSPDGECLTVVDRHRATVFRAPLIQELDFDWLRP